MWDLEGGEVPPSGVGRAGNPYQGFLNELESGMYLALSEYLTSGGIITRTIVSLSLSPSPWLPHPAQHHYLHPGVLRFIPFHGRCQKKIFQKQWTKAPSLDTLLTRHSRTLLRPPPPPQQMEPPVWPWTRSYIDRAFKVGLGTTLHPEDRAWVYRG